MEMRLYFMQTRSGLHCGVGQGISDIDLPTAKDAVTGHPLVPGSSVKGVLRDHFDDGTSGATAAFGTPSGSGADRAAALSFTDSRLVCLPVRSYFGTFAHLASPYTLQKLKEELQRAGFHQLPPVPLFQTVGENENFHAMVCSDTRLVHQGRFAGRLLLEELDLLVDSREDNPTDQWARLIGACIYPDDVGAREQFCRGFAIVDDNVFDFFCETALPVAAHNTIGENGVVADGALWYEEFVPAEAVFSGAVYGTDSRIGTERFAADALLDLVCDEPLDIQVGGSATTGRGLVTLFFIRNEEGRDED